MNKINLAAFWFALSLLILDALSYGFVLGFGAFLAVVAGVTLVMWGYWRCVVNRPRAALAGAFVGEYYGCKFYA